MALRPNTVAFVGMLIKWQKSNVIHRPMCRLLQKSASLYNWF